MGSKPSVYLFDNCISQARHRIARQRPTSLLSWSTGNERGEEESKLLPVLVEGWGEGGGCGERTRKPNPSYSSSYTFLVHILLQILQLPGCLEPRRYFQWIRIRCENSPIHRTLSCPGSTAHPLYWASIPLHSGTWTGTTNMSFSRVDLLDAIVSTMSSKSNLVSIETKWRHKRNAL